MKDAIDSVPAHPMVESDGFANRKLIRPSLSRPDGRNEHNHAPSSMADRRTERPDRNGGIRKAAPPEQTNAENFYYQKQMQSKTPMVIVLRDGEYLHGVIEWYDKNCLKINRTGAPNLIVYKPSIKYMYKDGENTRK
jgi:host factor-I protein